MAADINSAAECLNVTEEVVSTGGKNAAWVRVNGTETG